MKRPFDHTRDMPTHVVHHLEVRDLPTLPRNLDWCFPELNMYAQTGLFPLHFQKQLMAYYDESIAYMCDTREDYRTLQNHFTAVDNKHGEPDNFDVPSQVHVDWCRWAHERTVNEGYSPEDSHKWLLERELILKDFTQSMNASMISFSHPAGKHAGYGDGTMKWVSVPCACGDTCADRDVAVACGPCVWVAILHPFGAGWMAWAAFAAVAVATVSPAQPKRTLRLACLVAEIDSSLLLGVPGANWRRRGGFAPAQQPAKESSKKWSAQTRWGWHCPLCNCCETVT
eukprot:6491669-Amphidinium_carterae.3